MRNLVLMVCAFAILTVASCKKEGGDSNNDTCPATTGLVNSFQASISAAVTWSSTSSTESFDLRYRKVGETNWIANSSGPDLTIGTVTISGLTPNTSYEWQVKRSCATEYSASQTFTTKPLVLKAKYKGVEHTFAIKEVHNPLNYSDVLTGLTVKPLALSTGQMYISGTEASTGNTISLSMNGKYTGTYSPVDIILKIGSTNYEAWDGSKAVVTLYYARDYATIDFLSTMANPSNPVDSFALTNGYFSGTYKEF